MTRVRSCWALLGIGAVCQAWAACGKNSADAARCGPPDVTVTSVVDGDTVDVNDGRRLRYLLIDTPEIDTADCYATNARDLNSSLVLGQTAQLEYDTECEDRFGRTLAYVSVGERMINRILLERGYARLLVIEPNTKYVDEFTTLEAEAQAAHAGLWGACP